MDLVDVRNECSNVMLSISPVTTTSCIPGLWLKETASKQDGYLKYVSESRQVSCSKFWFKLRQTAPHNGNYGEVGG
jgi:hypothetical protein